MRSIRVSLVVYFLLLLAAALGAASLLVYQTSQQTLLEKKDAAGRLIEAHYDENCRQEKAKLDDYLLLEAQSLARQTQTQLDWGRSDRQVGMLGMFAWPLGPDSHLTAPVWVAQAIRNPSNPGPRGPHWARSPFYPEQPPTGVADIHFATETPEVPAQPGEYFQIDSAWGASYRSPSLGAYSFPVDPNAFAPEQVLSWEWTDDVLGPDQPVRRVMLKTSARLTMPIGRPKPDARPELQPRSAIYIQCASSTAQRDAALRQFAASRDDDLARVDRDTGDSLAALRNRLLLMAGVAFAAAALGCYGLVRLGLSPLRRVSDAVSRVSEKDFRLQVDKRRLPGELKPIVQRLTDTLEQLRRAFAREKQATADISHELRTPLAALLTTTELALRKPRTAEEYQELLQDCRLSAQQMTRAVERLLALARLDAGVDRLRPVAVDAGDVAEQCAALVRPLAEARGLRLTVRRDGPAPLKADPDKLREVITNLLHNAVQYNRPDGAIDLTVARENGRLRVEVKDTGIGISPEDQARIFERFYRSDPSRGEDGLHAGLGLAIVKGYLDLMGGAIEVDSVKGKGSTFRAYLPA
jgi:two-component system, OmpR family, heavy metal sensor histidine kinase CusS